MKRLSTNAPEASLRLAGVNYRPRVLLNAGEPAGIGPELCLALADLDLHAELVVVGDPKLLQQRSQAIGSTVAIEVCTAEQVFTSERRTGVLRVLALDYPAKDCVGTPNPANAPELLRGLALATRLVLESRADALVTAPVQKSVINDAGIAFSGHTEYLADLCQIKRPVMMLAADTLRVALVTTHLPLADVPAAITPVRIRETLEVLNLSLQERYGIANPTIGVCGLNPHAGEGGHLGHEENTVIAPTLDKLRQDGMTLHGPLPADTIFTPNAGQTFDAILAMYHDQGLPVLKFAGFGHAVNVTLGLPIIRTSVDHGTALDLAGTGQADHQSLVAAIAEAVRMSCHG